MLVCCVLFHLFLKLLRITLRKCLTKFVQYVGLSQSNGGAIMIIRKTRKPSKCTPRPNGRKYGDGIIMPRECQFSGKLAWSVVYTAYILYWTWRTSYGAWRICCVFSTADVLSIYSGLYDIFDCTISKTPETSNYIVSGSPTFDAGRDLSVISGLLNAREVRECISSRMWQPRKRYWGSFTAATSRTRWQLIVLYWENARVVTYSWVMPQTLQKLVNVSARY